MPADSWWPPPWRALKPVGLINTRGAPDAGRRLYLDRQAPEAAAAAAELYVQRACLQTGRPGAAAAAAGGGDSPERC